MTEILKSGNYLGITKSSIDYNGILITDTLYNNDHEFAPHAHENLYIAYVIEGSYIESTRSETKRCLPGSVVLHRIDEKHTNSSFAARNRILNAEIGQRWFEKYNLSTAAIEKNISRNNFQFKILFSNLYNEYLINDNVTALAFETGILEAFNSVLAAGNFISRNRPEWVKKTEEILRFEEPSRLDLTFLANETGVHPAHISRDFKRYFRCTMSEYVRRLKVEKAGEYLTAGKFTLAEVSYICGFADQSHFTRIFKKFKGLTPLEYKNLVIN
ncbi:MAG: AraC family transcriptional regulator [Ignavibacteria bacterium]|nr:AraC family transcriptional regulator [Ignavibacteria bacterium]